MFCGYFGHFYFFGQGGGENFGHVAKGGEKIWTRHLGGAKIVCLNKVIRKRYNDLRDIPPPHLINNDASLIGEKNAERKNYNVLVKDVILTSK